jgi:hypothetical protein
MRRNISITTISHAVLFEGSIRNPHRVVKFLARQLTTKSLPQIGRACGGVGSTNVVHAIISIERAMETDPVLRARIEELMEKFSGSRHIERVTRSRASNRGF